MKFIALDVETANADLASICQIGIAIFADDGSVEQWESLVDPEDEFDSFNIRLHGIDESSVVDAPTFPSLAEAFVEMLSDTVVVHHTHYDKAAIGQVFRKYDLEPPTVRWLDSARVVRRTWSQFSQRGYGLGPVTEHLGIEFKHHDAAEDARAAGEILLHAVRETGMSLDEWMVRVGKPIASRPSRAGEESHYVSREGNPEGPLFGEAVVFTGTLSMTRSEAADHASAAGCDVKGAVSKKTTLLVVGDQDIRKLSGHKKSTKHRKAEELILTGHPIRILCEADFLSIVSSDA
ncbi:MAG: exonuclease domain-containing protein [Fuerstiella sp.]